LVIHFKMITKHLVLHLKPHAIRGGDLLRNVRDEDLAKIFAVLHKLGVKKGRALTEVKRIVNRFLYLMAARDAEHDMRDYQSAISLQSGNAIYAEVIIHIIPALSFYKRNIGKNKRLIS